MSLCLVASTAHFRGVEPVSDETPGRNEGSASHRLLSAFSRHSSISSMPGTLFGSMRFSEFGDRLDLQSALCDSRFLGSCQCHRHLVTWGDSICAMNHPLFAHGPCAARVCLILAFFRRHPTIFASWPPSYQLHQRGNWMVSGKSYPEFPFWHPVFRCRHGSAVDLSRYFTSAANYYFLNCEAVASERRALRR